MLKKIFLLHVSLLIFHSFIMPQSESWENAYEKGKDYFYESLVRMASLAELEDKDRKLIMEARKRISGLYEHLMNFYFFAEPEEIAKNDVSRHIQTLSAEMAKEFMDSIPARRWEKHKSPLLSLLESTGFHARKFTPQFRKFLRPISRRAKSQWLLGEMEIRRAHSIAKGKGIRLDQNF